MNINIAEIFNRFLAYKLFGYVKKTRQRWVNNDGTRPVHYPYGINISKSKPFTGNNGKPYPAIDSRYYAGGIGTECYYEIAKAIGGVFVHTASGKTFDVFTYTDRRKK